MSSVVLALAACSFVVGGEWDRVRDVDGDGEVAERFGGRDCLDDDPEVRVCDEDGDGEDSLRAGGTDCDDSDPDASALESWFRDKDGDGYGDPLDAREQCGASDGWVRDDGDCRDGDETVHPGVDETCDALDRDCDGDPYADAVDAVPFPSDRDGDGFGGDDLDGAVYGCVPPRGYAPPGDCDDDRADVNPDAAEVLYDRVDEDCDGTFDNDGDDDGDDAEPFGRDCDDLHAGVRPGSDEQCNGVDDDCDGVVDEDAVDRVPFWPDADGDGDGDERAPLALHCLGLEPPGLVTNPNDCDDSDPGVYPGAPESCDARDEDCDGTADEGASDAFPVFLDLDGDGWGGVEVETCFFGPAAVAVGGDCNDANPAFHPGAVEVCGDDVRQDCSASDPADCDGDGVLPPDDCLDDPGDDRRAAEVHPGAPEACDGLDNDCDGASDADDPDAPAAAVWPDWFVDADGDGFGGPIGAGSASCDPPSAGAAPNADDCDDTRASAFPGGIERCDGVDQDCDGVVDDGVAPGDGPTWYLDGDGDGVGAGIGALACAAPGPDHVALGGDCDDGDAAIAPGAEEVCNATDDDCDGLVDGSDADLDRRLYPDLDGDGFGVEVAGVATCVAAGPGTSDTPGDCDDGEPEVSPDAIEACNDGRDDDCDGLPDQLDDDVTGLADRWPDRDGDGHGELGAPSARRCPTEGWVGVADDCDDGDPSVAPGQPERCGGGDEDCDGLADDADSGVVGQAWGFPDTDGDGFGVDLAFGEHCVAAARGGDCDDVDPLVSPRELERCNGRDDDCDGTTDLAPVDGTPHWPDLDGDGYGDGAPELACAGVDPTLAPRDGDCLDASDLVHPGAFDACDDVDANCDGDTDEGRSLRHVDFDGDGFGSPEQRWYCPGHGAPDPDDCDDGDPAVGNDGVTWYRDVDLDGFGDPGDTRVECGGGQPGGYVADATDCDDGRPDVFPLATEVCDGVDQDCDNVVDDGGVCGGPPPGDRKCWIDVDGDGYGFPEDEPEFLGLPSCPVGYADNALDCPPGKTRTIRSVALDQLDEEWAAMAGSRADCVIFDLLDDQALASDLLLPANVDWRVRGHGYAVTSPAAGFQVAGGSTLVLEDLTLQNTGLDVPNGTYLALVDTALVGPGPSTVTGVDASGFATFIGEGTKLVGWRTALAVSADDATLRRTEIRDVTDGIVLAGSGMAIRTLDHLLVAGATGDGVRGYSFDLDHATIVGCGVGVRVTPDLSPVSTNAHVEFSIVEGSAPDIADEETGTPDVVVLNSRFLSLRSVQGPDIDNSPIVEAAFIRTAGIPAVDWDLHLYPQPCSDAWHRIGASEDWGFYPAAGAYYSDDDDGDGMLDGWEDAWGVDAQLVDLPDFQSCRQP